MSIATTQKIDPKYFPALGRIFSPVVMDSIALKGHSGYLAEVFENSGLIEQIDKSMELAQFFDWIYSFLLKNYKNEYIYKNAIANKILLGKHSLNTSHLLNEFRVGKCKADAVVLNGTSTVYEIKSEYDSFVRLENQVNAYLQVFDNINVITSELQAEKLANLLPEKIGIMILTSHNSIKTKRASESNVKNINLGLLFESLRKVEYTSVIKEYFGSIPEVPNTQIFRVCKELFCSIPIEEAHNLTIKILRKRRKTQVLMEFINNAPSSLSAYGLSKCSDKEKMQALISRFSFPIESVLIPRSF